MALVWWKSRAEELAKDILINSKIIVDKIIILCYNNISFLGKENKKYGNFRKL